METNATRMCERLVGLPDVTILGVDDQPCVIMWGNAAWELQPDTFALYHDACFAKEWRGVSINDGADTYDWGPIARRRRWSRNASLTPSRRRP